jgi:hypothetical protein
MPLDPMLVMELLNARLKALEEAYIKHFPEDQQPLSDLFMQLMKLGAK